MRNGACGVPCRSTESPEFHIPHSELPTRNQEGPPAPPQADDGPSVRRGSPGISVTAALNGRNDARGAPDEHRFCSCVEPTDPGLGLPVVSEQHCGTCGSADPPASGRPRPRASSAPSQKATPPGDRRSHRGVAFCVDGAARSALASGNDLSSPCVRSARMSVGLGIMGSNMGGTSTVAGRSGEASAVERTLGMTRVSAFGQFGPYVGPVRPYGEVILGVNVLSSSVDGPEGEDEMNTVAAAAGIGVGVEVGLPATVEEALALPSTAVRIEGRHVFGGPAEYHVYDRATATLSTRSANTTVSSFSVGLTANF